MLACRIINSVLMDNVAVEDGCNIQNAVICPNAHLQACRILSFLWPCINPAWRSSSMQHVSAHFRIACQGLPCFSLRLRTSSCLAQGVHVH